MLSPTYCCYTSPLPDFLVEAKVAVDKIKVAYDNQHDRVRYKRLSEAAVISTIETRNIVAIRDYLLPEFMISNINFSESEVQIGDKE